MKNLDINQITEKIMDEYGFSQELSRSNAERLIAICPESLGKNVEEWLSDKELSDIFIDRYSLPMILSIWHSTDFLRAMEVMSKLSEGEVQSAEFMIWNGSR